jgi:mono/diheme cytochrome c family protein
MRALRVTVALAAATVWGCSMTMQHESREAEAPHTSAAVVAGREEFVRACATCHGVDGRGNGPVVAALRSQPPDLTTLTRRATGRFPRERVVAVLAGDMPEAAHGTKELPVWGARFAPHAAGAEETAPTDERMAAIVDYLASIQRTGP